MITRKAGKDNSFPTVIPDDGSRCAGLPGCFCQRTVFISFFIVETVVLPSTLPVIIAVSKLNLFLTKGATFL